MIVVFRMNVRIFKAELTFMYVLVSRYDVSQNYTEVYLLYIRSDESKLNLIYPK